MFFNAIWNVFGGFAGSLEAGSFMMVCSEAEYFPFRACETRLGEVKASPWGFLTRRCPLGHHGFHRYRVETRECRYAFCKRWALNVVLASSNGLPFRTRGSVGRPLVGGGRHDRDFRHLRHLRHSTQHPRLDVELHRRPPAPRHDL
jgi:hypothetical protein